MDIEDAAEEVAEAEADVDDAAEETEDKGGSTEVDEAFDDVVGADADAEIGSEVDTEDD